MEQMTWGGDSLLSWLVRKASEEVVDMWRSEGRAL